MEINGKCYLDSEKLIVIYECWVFLLRLIKVALLLTYPMSQYLISSNHV